MASKSALLRNIRPSGGLFTENILLRLRDNPERVNIGKIDSFLEDDTKEARKKLTDKKQIIFDWCIQKWDEISPNIEEWSIEDLAKKWLIPLFTLFDHEIEDFEINKENLDEDSVLKGFRISYQSRDHKDPFFHYVSVDEDFDSKIDRNPQKKSHHNVCQQFINFNPEIKWLFLSNGRILRILTKYYHSYSKGYLEFDLENIFANRDEREFNSLYSIIHSSRFNSEAEDGTFLLDNFQKDSITEGVKIGDILRDNVEHALELLGNELIQQNLDKIDLDIIDVNEFYAELLRIIYRIIFILYAEQRDMLPGAGSLYFEQFSLSSLRIRAEKPIKAEKNYDLWNKTLLTFNLVRDGNSLLGVNSYNGGLFKEDNLLIVLKNGMKISNDIVLKVIRLLTTSANHKVRQRINFLEVSEEEIGAIYESLLDFKPYISSTSQFHLIEGTERKSTGSYYTPKALIDILIRTTLQPLVEDRLIKAGDDLNERIKALLDIKICDPACGGGTFLLSALDFLGKKLAEVKTGADSPLEDDLREARRYVLQHCIYGVDMNPLAVELAKMSLWLRACVKDKPLNFLDNHIKCGNSLVGFGQKVEVENIDPNAFKAISGNKATGIPTENIKLQNMARKYIRNEINERKKDKRKVSTITSFMMEKETADICSVEFKKIIELSEDNSQKIEEKEAKYKLLRKNPKYMQSYNEANIWTSCYFWSFEGDVLNDIPNHTLINELRDKVQNKKMENLMEKINKINEEIQFFHWYIEFPEVFSIERGGFDCILTNPPWETLQLKEHEFFAGINNEIVDESNQSERRKLIKALKIENPNLFDRYRQAWQNYKKVNNFLTKSGLFDLSARGTINTYALFLERCWNLTSLKGYSGIICPTGIIMNYYTQDLFKKLVENNAIFSIFDFENTNKLFDIHRQYRFCLITISGKNLFKGKIPMTFYTINPIDIQESLSIIFESSNDLEQQVKNLPSSHNLVLLDYKDLELFNPNSLSCPVFRSRYDYILMKKIYKKNKVLFNKKDPIIPSLEIHRMFHMSGDSKSLFTEKKLKDVKRERKDWILNKDSFLYYPIYESKLFWIYDHRFSSFEGCSENDIKNGNSKLVQNKTKNIYYSSKPRMWIEEKKFIEKKLNWNWNNKWFLAVRLITGATNQRTCVATILPNSPSSNSLNLFLGISSNEAIYLLSNMNSLIFDYIVRLKLSGSNLMVHILEQLPIIDLNKWKKVQDSIIPRVLELVYTSFELRDFAKDLGYDQEPFEWISKRRAQVQAEIDAIYAFLYDINKKDLIYILETFTVLKKKEIEKFKEYQTKRLILEAYDKFSEQKELFE